ncbi:MAG TPA: GNAT family N-acetyltransferase [Dehalococcoidia bacterium]|nr:GNAT family N-acetyltransferase [Dehalococcoidia bacterium]
MTTSIRTAVLEDLPHLVELLQQMSLDTLREDMGAPLPAVYSKAFAVIDADPNQTLLVAEADGLIVGTACLIVIPNLSYRARPHAIIENVVVDSSARSRGVGEQLIRRAIDVAREAGCYKVTLTSNKARIDAHRFYERLGFKTSHVAFRHDL